VRAADEKEEANRSFNPWRTGTDPVEPRIARDFFVRMSLPLAAEHELTAKEILVELQTSFARSTELVAEIDTVL
jgi:hypothetical protein